LNIKLKKYLSDTFFYASGDILNKFASFILIPFYTNIFNQYEYGVLAIIIIINAILSHVVSFASKATVFRLYYDYRKPDDRKKIIFTSVSVIIIIAFLMLIIFIIFNSIGIKLSEVDYFKYIYYLIFYSAFLSIIDIALVILRIEKKVKEYAGFQFLKTILELSIIIFYVKYLNGGVLGVVKGWFISSLITVTILSFVVIKKHIKTSFDKRFYSNFFIFASPIIVHNLIGWLLVSYDKLIVNSSFGYIDLAILTLGLQVISIFKITMEGVLKSLHVYIYETIETTISKYYRQIITAFLSLFSFIACLIVVFCNEIIELIANKKYFESTVIIKYILFPRILILYYEISAMILYSKKESLYVTKITIISGIITLIFSTTLIPKYHFVGVAISSLIVSLFCSIALSIRVKRYIIAYFSIKNYLILGLFLLSLYIAFAYNTFEINIIYSMIFLTILVTINLKFVKRIYR
jgi:O-antigen/teichoic acid export membrane protein